MISMVIFGLNVLVAMGRMGYRELLLQLVILTIVSVCSKCLALAIIICVICAQCRRSTVCCRVSVAGEGSTALLRLMLTRGLRRTAHTCTKLLAAEIGRAILLPQLEKLSP